MSACERGRQEPRQTETPPMVCRPHSRQVMVATFLLGATFTVSHAQEQATAGTASRFKVLVPTLEPRGGAKANFGKDVSEEVRKLISRMARHEPVDKKEIQEAFRKYQLKESDMDCIKNMQLALNLGAKLVMCGSFSGAAPNVTVDSVQFISTETNEAFTVQALTSATPKDAAAQI